MASSNRHPTGWESAISLPQPQQHQQHQHQQELQHPQPQPQPQPQLQPHQPPAQQLPPTHPGDIALQDVTDKEMIRHLARRYTLDQLVRLFNEEGRSSNSDRASIASGSGYAGSGYAPSIISINSARSDDPASIFDSGASLRSFSDTSSITGSSISSMTQKTQRLFGRKSVPTIITQPAVWTADSAPLTSSPATMSPTAATNDVSPSSSSSSTSASAAATISKQKGSFTCGFCAEEGLHKTCTRKNDLKRHIEDFHHNDAQWFCRQRGCCMVFDWQTAYKAHIKSAHGGSRMALDDAKVALCSQVVFACGFSGCAAVFEAVGSADSPATFKEYVSHVVKHFDEAAGPGEWTYNRRMQNLLRQSGVFKGWIETVPAEDVRNRLAWTPQTSVTLRKRLETRHIGDLHQFVQFAYMLGAGQVPPERFQHLFKPPFREECGCRVPGHDSRVDMHATASLAAAGPPSCATDSSMQFRIARNPNPDLAAYIASQRAVRVPPRPASSVRTRPPPPQLVRSSLSHMSTTSGPAPMPSAHFFSPLPSESHLGSPPGPDPTMFHDPRNSAYGTGVGLVPQVPGMMHSGMAMPQGGDGGGDVDMADMSGFSSYAGGGFHSPLTPDSALTSPTTVMPAAFYDDRHPY